MEITQEETRSLDEKNLIQFFLDLSNITRSKPGENNIGYIDRFEIVRDTLLLEYSNLNPKITGIADAALKYKIDNLTKFLHYEQIGDIILSPAEVDADLLILKITKAYENAFIVSNDLYREYRNEFGKKWVKKHRIAFFFIEDPFNVVLLPCYGTL